MIDDTIQVWMVEDDPLIRKTVETYLNGIRGFKARAFGSVEEMQTAFHESEIKPEVVLMDIELPGISGIEGIQWLKEQSGQIEAVMLTVYHDETKIFKSLCAGASGYLLKNTPLSDFPDHIRDILAGGSPMSPAIARNVVRFFHSSSSFDGEQSSLTSKEQQVVDCIVNGMSYKLIGKELEISIDTVRYHIRNIYKKLQVNSKTEVIAKAMKRGSRFTL